MAGLVEIIGIFISSAGAVGVAIIGAQSSRKSKKDEAYRKHREHSENVRANETYLQMKMVSATLDLAYVTSLAVTGGKINGNVKEAQDKADKAKEEYYDFVNKEHSKEVYTDPFAS